MWEFENDKWIDNCIWNSVDNDWLKIIAAEFKNIKICMTIVVIYIIFIKIKVVEQSEFKMSIFMTWLLFMINIMQHIIIHMIFTKIEVTEFKMPIFATWLLLHDQHIIVYIISAKIEAAELKTLIFAA